MSPSEAAELLGVHPRTLSRWEQAGKLHVIRTVGGHRRYRRAEVLALRMDVAGGPATVAEPGPPMPVSPEATPPAVVPTSAQRARARRRALEILHAADVAGADPLAGLTPDDHGFTHELVRGVVAHRDEIDAMIEERAERWSIDRMPVVDRNLLRLGVFELLHADTPAGVAIDQAVQLAKLLSTEGSGRFINGILGRIAREQLDH